MTAYALEVPGTANAAAPRPASAIGRWLRVLGFATLGLLTTGHAQTKDDAPRTPVQLHETTVNDVEQGSLLLHADGGRRLLAPLVDTDVKMQVNGLIARVTVRQSFSNPGEDWVNGTYVFPLPERSAVDRLRMRVGERVIEGRISERGKARATFTAAKRAGKKATLIEQQRPNLFTSRVANIGPAETVIVELEYQQTLDYEGGWFSLRFPMTVGVRYIPGSGPVGGFDDGGWAFNTDQVPDASAITPPMTPAGVGHDNPIALRVELDAGLPLAAIESPYHGIRRTDLGQNRYAVELDATRVSADRDFVLRYRATAGQEPRAAFFRQEVGEAAYGLLMLVPPEAEWSKREAAAREVVFVIDTSGSMSGGSIEQARSALLDGLSRLHHGDRFNIVQFNSHTSALWPQARPVTDPNLAAARRYVSALRADGGTEMATALSTVLDGQKEHDQLRQIIFITDGAVGNEQALLNLIENRLGAARLFTVGIGSAPNTYFMREAAHVGRGTFTYVGKKSEVRNVISGLFAKLEFPVLADIELTADGSGDETLPARVKDLYANEAMLLSFKLDDASTLTLSGVHGGNPWSTQVPLANGGDAVGLDVAWARQAIADLERSLARGANREQVRESITSLGLEHHLVTAYTSLVAVDTTPSRPATKPAHDAKVPNKMPAGWKMQAPGQRLPATATPLHLHAAIALVLALLAGFIRWVSHRMNHRDVTGPRIGQGQGAAA